MSSVVGSIIAKLQLNIDNFAANLKNAENQLKATEEKFKGFDDIGGRFTDIGKSLTLGVTAPAIGLGTAIVKTSSNFQAAMSKVQAISGATGDDFEALKEKAKEMGAKTQFSASESADAMSYMAMAGWNSSQILQGLGGVMDLAAASGEDLASVSDIVTDAMTAFGLQASDASHFSDVLAQASNRSNTSVGLLGESFKYVAPVAGALKFSVEDTSLALGLMANSGIKGSQAGTALRAALSRMVKPTGEAAKMMQKYGLSMTNSDGSMKSLGQVMNELREKLGGLDESTKAQVASTIFGQEAMSGMLAIINAAPGDYENLCNALNNADGTASKVAETMNDNLAGKMKILMSAVEGVAIKLGEILIPIMTNVVEKVTKVVEWFGNLSEGTQKTILAVVALAATIGPLLIGVGNLITAVSKINKAFTKGVKIINKLKDCQKLAAATTKGLELAQAALNFVMSLNPVTLIIAGIVALIAVFVVLWNKCDAFREFWINLWEAITESCSKAWEWIKQKASECIDWLLEGWEGFQEWWNGFWEWLKGIPAKAWQWVKDKANECCQWVESVWDSFLEWWNGFWEWLKGAPERMKNWVVELFTNIWEDAKQGWENFKIGLENLWNGIVEWFSGIWETITGIFRTALDSFTNTFSGAVEGVERIWQGVQEFFAGAWEVIKNIFGGALLFILDLITLDFEQMKSDMIHVFENIKEGLGLIWQGIKDIFSGTLTAIKEFWFTSWEWIKQKASEIWEGIKQFFINTWESLKQSFFNWLDGLKILWDNTLNWIKETAVKIWEGIKQFFIDSWNYIKNAFFGFIEELKNSWNRSCEWISNKAHEIWEGLKQFFVNTWNNIKQGAINGWNALKDAVVNTCKSIVQWVKDIWNGIINWFKELPSRLRQIGSDMFTRMKDGVTSTISGVSTSIQNGLNNALNFLKNLPKQALTWGRHMIEGFIDGIKSAVGKLQDAVKGVAQGIRNFLGFSIPKKGPLHVYMEWMPHMLQGMTASLNANKDKLLNAAVGVAGELSDAMSSDVQLAVAGNVPVTAPKGGKNSFVPKDSNSSEIKQLIHELKSLQDSKTEYNINIDKVNADDPNDIRKLAEELEAFKENNKRF